MESGFDSLAFSEYRYLTAQVPNRPEAFLGLSNWYLYKDHFVSYKMYESNDENAEVLVKDVDKMETEKDFGKISFDDFNIYNQDGN